MEELDPALGRDRSGGGASELAAGLADARGIPLDGRRDEHHRLLAAGAPGEYERPPWFVAGASRFVAVQTGGMGDQCLADYARMNGDEPAIVDAFNETPY